MHDLIIQSNLLSGGIENRNISMFSSESQIHIQDLIKISQDAELSKLLNAKPQASSDDNLISALIHPGENEIVDKLVTFL